MSRLQFQKKIDCVMTHPFWLHVNDLVVPEINVKIFMEYYLLLKWLLQMVNVKSYGLPDCAWSNVWIDCEPWQTTYIVKNPYFFYADWARNVSIFLCASWNYYNYGLKQHTCIFLLLFCDCWKVQLLMSYMHFNNRNLSIIIHLITTPLHMCTECGNEWRVPQSMAAHKLLFCCFAKR